MICSSILIVEDDEDIREVMQEAIELEGYQVVTASNGLEGLERLEHLPRPSLILLDLMMPVMDGWKFAEKLQSDKVLAKIPIVVVTAFADKADTIKPKAILKKPIEIEALFSLIKQFCGSV